MSMAAGDERYGCLFLWVGLSRGSGPQVRLYCGHRNTVAQLKTSPTSPIAMPTSIPCAIFRLPAMANPAHINITNTHNTRVNHQSDAPPLPAVLIMTTTNTIIGAAVISRLIRKSLILSGGTSFIRFSLRWSCATRLSTNNNNRRFYAHSITYTLFIQQFVIKVVSAIQMFVPDTGTVYNKHIHRPMN